MKSGETLDVRCPINPILNRGKKASPQPAIMRRRKFALSDSNYIGVDFKLEEA